MVINKHNLSIAEHCAPAPVRGYRGDMLHLTDTGTLAVNGPYSISVSALDTGARGAITVEKAKCLELLIGDGLETLSTGDLDDVTLKIPLYEKYLERKSPVFEMFIDADILAMLARQASVFGGKGLRVEFTGELEPVRMSTRNAETGQTWEALVMPRTPGVDESDFDRAMRLAAAL